MSKVIDQNVVKLEFDNGLFERNVNQSMSTLDRLKKALKLESSAEGIKNVSEEAKKIDLSAITNAIETVKVKFSAMQYAAFAVFQNIVNRAIDTGERMIRALTIDPISDGFREYELKMNSVQTMMMSSGESLETVNGYLGQLNTYADKTIYSFSDMTENIGKFTNAGVKLKDAVSAIQGISNEAALSGANANEASRAMYNFAQALSAGSVKLIDWKSIENANMATVEFKNELLKTALALGTVVESEGKYKTTTKDANGKVSELFTATQSFNDSLSAQWMTTDVLVQTLAKYSDETTEIGKRAFEAATKVKTFTQLVDTLKEAVGSGWSESFEIMFGDFEEAKKFYTEISDTLGSLIGDQANRRNAFLTDTFSTGWKRILREGIFDAKMYRETVTSVAKENGIAVDELIKKNGSFEASLKEGWATSKILATSLSKMTDHYSKLSDEELRATGYTREQVNELKKLNDGVKNGTIDLGKFADAMKLPSGRENFINILRNSFNALMSVVKPVGDGLRDVFGKIDGRGLYNVIKTLSDFTSKLSLTESESKNLRSTIKGLAAVVNVLWEVLKKAAVIASPILMIIRPILDAVLLFTGKIGEAIYALENALVNNKALKNFNESYLSLVQNTAKSVSESYKGVIGFVTSVVEFFKQMNSGLKTAFDSVSKGIGDSENKLLSRFTPLINFISKVGTLIGKIVVELRNAINDVFGDFNFLDYVTRIIHVLAGMGLISILSKITKTITDFKSITKSIPEFMESISGSLDKVGDILGGFRKKVDMSVKMGTVTRLILFAGAIAILATALYELGKLNFKEVAVGVTGMLGVLTTIAIGIRLIAKTVKTIPKSDLASIGELIGMLYSFGQALIVLSTAVQMLGELSWDGLAKGLIGVTTLSATMIVCAKVLSTCGKNVMKGAINMVIFALAIKTLATAIEPIGKLDWATIAKGLTAIGALCLEMVVAFKLMSKNQGSILKGSIAMSIAAGAVVKMIKPMQTFGSMDWMSIGKGLTTIAGTLAIFALGLKALSNASAIGGVASLLGATIALNALIVPLKMFSGMSLSEIGTSLLMLGGVLATLALGLKMIGSASSMKGVTCLNMMVIALSLLTPSLLAFSQLSWGSLLKSVGVLAIVLSELAIGMKIMSSNAMGAASMLLIAVALDAVVAGLIALSALKFKDVLGSLLSLAAIFGALALAANLLQGSFIAMMSLSVMMIAIGASCVVLGTGLSFLGAGLETFVRIWVGNVKLIVTSMVETFPSIIELVKLAIIGFCDVIISCAPKIGEAFRSLIAFFVDMVVELTPYLAESFVKLVDGILKSLADHAPSICDSLVRILVGIVEAIANYIQPLVDAGRKIVGVLFAAIFEPIKLMSPDEILKLVTSAAILTAFMVAMNLLSALIPGAMVGLLKFSAFIAEFIAILSLIGAIHAIPGVSWLMESGSAALETIGVAIGKFIGGIFGGVAKGATGTLPEVAQSLSDFMVKLRPFLIGMKGMDFKSFDVIDRLVSALMKLTAHNIKKAFAGGVTFERFGEDLIPFGQSLVKFTNVIKDIDQSAVTNATSITKVIIELMKGMPRAGGMASSKSISNFVECLPILGQGINVFSTIVKGVDVSAVVAASQAIKAITDVAKALPKNGGFMELFTGKRSITDFAHAIIPLGGALRAFSNSSKGVDVSSVSNAVTAAKAVSEFANGLPKRNGFWQMLTGQNSLLEFANDMVKFGPCLKRFSNSVHGIDTGEVVAATNAAKVISEFAGNLPTHNGFVQIWAGDSSMSRFAEELVVFAPALKRYGAIVNGLDGEVVVNSANAAKVLAEFAKEVPDYGGAIASWNGDNRLSTFAEDLSEFGPALRRFSISVSDMDPNVVINAANSAKVIAEFAKEAPSYGGLASAWNGDINLEKFGDQISAFGRGLKHFGENVKDLDVKVVENAASAAKTISAFATEIPKVGGLSSLFTGDINLGAFGEQLEAFGPSLKTFADSVTGMDPNVVINASNAAKTVAEFAKEIPSDGGWFQEGDTLVRFGQQVAQFGPYIKSYADSVTGLDSAIVENSANAAKSLAELNAAIPEQGGLVGFFSGDNGMAAFGEQLVQFANHMVAYSVAVAGVDTVAFDNSIANIKKMVDIANLVKDIEVTKIGDLGQAMYDLGDAGASGFIRAFTDSYEKARNAGAAMVENISRGTRDRSDGLNSTIKYIVEGACNNLSAFDKKFYIKGETFHKELTNGFKAYYENVKTVAVQIAAAASNSVSSFESSFYTSGVNMSYGLGNGISDGSSYAISQAITMARSALEAAKRELDIRSPSKKMYQVGRFFDEGFSNGIDDNSSMVIESSKWMVDEVVNEFAKALSVAQEASENVSALTPVIRPIMDLSDVRSGYAYLSEQSAKHSYLSTNSIRSISIDRPIRSVDFIGELSSISMREQIANGVSDAMTSFYGPNKDSNPQPSDVNVNNYFDINGTSDPTRVANEVSKRLGKQMNRRGKVWA